MSFEVATIATTVATGIASRITPSITSGSMVTHG